MNQKQFIKEIKELTKDRTNEELNSIILKLSKNIPNIFYDKLLYSIKNILNIEEIIVGYYIILKKFIDTLIK